MQRTLYAAGMVLCVVCAMPAPAQETETATRVLRPQSLGNFQPQQMALSEGRLLIAGCPKTGSVSRVTDVYGSCQLWEVELTNGSAQKRRDFAGVRVLAMNSEVLVGQKLRENVVQILDIKTGQWRSIDTGVRCRAAAIAGNRVVAVLETAGGLRLRAYGLADGTLEAETAAGLTDPMGTLIACPSAERCVLADRYSLQVVALRLGQRSLSAASPVQLSGSEASYSVEAEAAARRRNAAPAQARMVLLGGYAPSASGTDLFVLLPSGRQGMRLAEFDSSGRQLRSFRFKDEVQQPWGFYPQAVASDENTISVVAFDGAIHLFRRP